MYFNYNMQNELTESVQQSIRPGEMCDLMYCGETNITKQAYPCVVNTKFVQAFTSLGAGSSTFIISPNQGVSDMVLSMSIGATAAIGGYTLPNGFGYSLVNRVSVRYGSSAQFFWSGQQLLLQNLYDAENSDKRDQLLSLGGNYNYYPSPPAAALAQNAYVYLKLPHNSIRADGKPLPFNSDILVQPIVVTIELYPIQSAFFANTGASAFSTLPATLASAQLQVKQEMLTDTSDLLARRVDMNSSAYTFCLPYFAQQQVQIPLSASSVPQAQNLTSFRAGEVRTILLWLTKTTDFSMTGSANAGPFITYPLSDVTLTYNGEIFSRFDGGSSALWALTGDTKTSVVNTSLLVATGAATAPTAKAQPWVVCDFSQVYLPSDRDSDFVHGKPILNAIVSVQFTTPDGSANYVLNAMYLYNASLLCSRGSAEYIF